MQPAITTPHQYTYAVTEMVSQQPGDCTKHPTHASWGLPENLRVNTAPTPELPEPLHESRYMRAGA